MAIFILAMSLWHFVTRVKRIIYWEISRDSSTLNVQVLTSVGEKLSQEEVFFSNIWYFSTTISYCPARAETLPYHFFFNECFGLTTLKSCQLPVIFSNCHIELSNFCFLVDELFGEAEVDEEGRLNYEVCQSFSLFLIVQLCFQKPEKVVAVIMIEPPKFRKLRALWNLMTMISQVLCQVLE